MEITVPQWLDTLTIEGTVFLWSMFGIVRAQLHFHEILSSSFSYLKQQRERFRELVLLI